MKEQRYTWTNEGMLPNPKGEWKKASVTAKKPAPKKKARKK